MLDIIIGNQSIVVSTHQFLRPCLERGRCVVFFLSRGHGLVEVVELGISRPGPRSQAPGMDPSRSHFCKLRGGATSVAHATGSNPGLGMLMRKGISAFEWYLGDYSRERELPGKCDQKNTSLSSCVLTRLELWRDFIADPHCQHSVDHVEHFLLQPTSSMDANGYSSLDPWGLVKTMV